MTSDPFIPGPVDGLRWHGHARVDKYRIRPSGLVELVPYETVIAENLLLTAGAGVVLDRLNEVTGVNGLGAANGRLCVGTGTAAVAVGQSDLQGATKLRHALDSAPTRTNNSAQYVATFLAAEGNFDWQECGLAVGAAGTLVNRFLQAFGVKSNTMQWTLTVTVTLV